MSKRHFDLARRIANDLPSSQHLRMHVDCNSEQCILVFDYFQDTLLSLLNNNPDLSPDERPKIMRSVGEAVNELHSRDWVHSGWSCTDGQNWRQPDRAAANTDQC